MSTSAPTLADALDFISGASSDDLDRVLLSYKDRQKKLREIRAAAVRRGVTVRTSNLTPKRYDGLEGEVTEVETIRTRTAVTLLLTEESTDTLRRSEYVPPETKRFPLRGVPATCCEVIDGSETSAG
ncbi:hypothetical protein [Streptomyces nanshensis]|uniref:Uncharacterized protein n=1 Tax=Streptomyces nanshensis TaxID=518642 RepID=A0A1E7L411_9ACTN|nr:hypothetical protein [Streptomyces nanshensis]OEV10922.1 hypothetical protein AN218_15395 [Streptomyces nanshensis]